MVGEAITLTNNNLSWDRLLPATVGPSTMGGRIRNHDSLKQLETELRAFLQKHCVRRNLRLTCLTFQSTLIKGNFFPAGGLRVKESSVAKTYWI
jgi:hypothetical protein